MLIPSHILVVPTESCLVHLSSLATSVKPYPGQGHALVRNNVLNLRDASVLPVAQGLWSSVGKSLNHLDLLFPVKQQFFCVLSHFSTILISRDGKFSIKITEPFYLHSQMTTSISMNRLRETEILIHKPYLFSNKK